MKLNANVSNTRSRKLFLRASTFSLVLLYLLLPFGNHITDLLHDSTHFIWKLSNKQAVAHDHAHKGDAHHHHYALESDIEEKNRLNKTEDHNFLNFLNAFVDFANDGSEEQVVVKITIDKHISQQFLLYTTPYLFRILKNYNPGNYPTLSKHCALVSIPPRFTV